MRLFYLGFPKDSKGNRRTFRAGVKCDKKGRPGEMVEYTEPQEVELSKVDGERFLADHGAVPDLLFSLEATATYIAEMELAETLEPDHDRMDPGPDHTATGEPE